MRVDGYKTIIGSTGLILVGIGTMFTGIAAFVGIMFPDYKSSMPDLTYDQALGTIAAGWAGIAKGIQGFGLAHKSEKILEAVKNG